jgi:xanthine dehydrogenase accessory factor
MTPETLAALEAAQREKRPVVLATRLPDGLQRLLPDPAAPAALNEAATAALAADESGTHKIAGEDWFLHAHNPPLRLIVVGAVHIAQGLVPFATQCGFAVTVVDPRRSFASDERFPNVTISTDWPDEALDAFKPDSRTAVVTLTHDPKLDDPALDRALKSEAFYIGALGSRRTHAARLGRLRELGHGENALSRILGPVGLNIEAVTAPEIALSIMAEIVGVRRGAALPEKGRLPAKAPGSAKAPESAKTPEAAKAPQAA